MGAPPITQGGLVLDAVPSTQGGLVLDAMPSTQSGLVLDAMPSTQGGLVLDAMPSTQGGLVLDAMPSTQGGLVLDAMPSTQGGLVLDAMPSTQGGLVLDAMPSTQGGLVLDAMPSTQGGLVLDAVPSTEECWLCEEDGLDEGELSSCVLSGEPKAAMVVGRILRGLTAVIFGSISSPSLFRAPFREGGGEDLRTPGSAAAGCAHCCRATTAGSLFCSRGVPSSPGSKVTNEQ